MTEPTLARVARILAYKLACGTWNIQRLPKILIVLSQLWKLLWPFTACGPLLCRFIPRIFVFAACSFLLPNEKSLGHTLSSCYAVCFSDVFKSVCTI